MQRLWDQVFEKSINLDTALSKPSPTRVAALLTKVDELDGSWMAQCPTDLLLELEVSSQPLATPQLSQPR